MIEKQVGLVYIISQKTILYHCNANYNHILNMGIKEKQAVIKYLYAFIVYFILHRSVYYTVKKTE